MRTEFYCAYNSVKWRTSLIGVPPLNLQTTSLLSLRRIAQSMVAMTSFWREEVIKLGVFRHYIARSEPWPFSKIFSYRFPQNI